MIAPPRQLAAAAGASEGGLAVLMYAARTELDPAGRQRLREVTSTVADWHRLLCTADRHAVLPLLYWQLNAVCPDLVPSAVRHMLAERFQRIHRHNLVFASELARMAGALEARGIRVVPYKGPLLAALVYGNVALRQFGDLDLLVRREQALAARDVLVELGYESVFPLRPEQEASYLRARYAYELQREDGLVDVELHWEVAPRYFGFQLDIARLWTRLEAVTLNGERLWSLAPDDLLLALCVHGVKHRWERLLWVCDVAEIVRARGAEIDWDALLRRARLLGRGRALGSGLYLARCLLEAQLPGQVERWVEADSGLRELGQQSLLALAADPPLSERALALRVFHLRSLERPLDRLRYCLGILTNPNQAEWSRVSFPAPLAFLYGIFRPLRLLAGVVGRLARRAT
jgi:hypothetical protein